MKLKVLLICNIFIFALLVIFGIYVFYSENKISEKRENSVYLYFGKTLEDKITEPQVIQRKISEKPGLFILVRELLKGPCVTEDQGKDELFTEIPGETKLLETRETEEYITINLSEDFESGGGSETMKYRLKQLIYTISGFSGNKPIYLELNGKRVKYIGGEGIEVPQPLLREY